jgi:hypothetical protein
MQPLSAATISSHYQQPLSNIEIANRQGVLLDEFPAGLYIVTHQSGEHLISQKSILDGHLQHPPRFWVHRRFPELFRVHLAETFVALDGAPFSRFSEQPL